MMNEELDFIKWAMNSGHGKTQVPMNLLEMILDYQKHVEAKFKNLDIQRVINCKPDTKAALNASVSAIYFADNSDYKSYHYEVIHSLTNLDEPTDQDINKLMKELNPD